MLLTDAQIDDSVDLGTWEIFGTIPAVAVVAAHYHRLVIDLNRSPDNWGDRGIVALSDYHGRRVYRPGSEPDTAKIERRISLYHRPFHARLERALGTAGVTGLIDCHSLNGVGPRQAPDNGVARKDIVLSNNGDITGGDSSQNDAATSDARTLQAGIAAFEAQGFSVSVNYPYRGGYIVTQYGHALRQRGGFAIQIEINQKLFIPSGEARCDKEMLRTATARITAALTSWACALKEGQYMVTCGCEHRTSLTRE